MFLTASQRTNVGARWVHFVYTLLQFLQSGVWLKHDYRPDDVSGRLAHRPAHRRYTEDSFLPSRFRHRQLWTFLYKTLRWLLPYTNKNLIRLIKRNENIQNLNIYLYYGTDKFMQHTNGSCVPVFSFFECHQVVLLLTPSIVFISTFLVKKSKSFWSS